LDRLGCIGLGRSSTVFQELDLGMCGVLLVFFYGLGIVSGLCSAPKYPKLTPHVLSEWMVEVCRFDKYRVGSLVGF